MGKEKANINDSFEWIKGCISSCLIDFHVDGCEILIQLFKVKYEDQEGFKEYYATLKGEMKRKEILLELH